MDSILFLASLIEKKTGYALPRGQYPHLERWVAGRSRSAGPHGRSAYVEALANNPAAPEWKELLAEILVKESSLFRIAEQFEALEHGVLPRFLEGPNRAHRHDLRIWSAGCARGEEPATLALVLAESPLVSDHRWRIVATDVDERALETARRGEYGARAVARVPPRLLAERFEKRGDVWRLDRSLLERIDYQVFNFFQTPYLSLGGPFDVIFLRNVLIYFQPEAQRRVLSRVISRLQPGGHLFLGHSETLRQLADPQLDAEMETLELGGCFVHRRRPPNLRSEPRAVPVGPAARRPGPASRAPLPPSQIARPQNPPSQIAPSTAPTSGSRASLGAAVEALAEDRLEEARELMAEMLVADPDDPSAHALLGLLHDLEGRAGAALDAYRKALYIDPSLYQVRYLRARRFEHLGEPQRAHGDYRQALTDLSGGRGHALRFSMPGLLPSREEVVRRSRDALARSAGSQLSK